jgi:guanylate kinase
MLKKHPHMDQGKLIIFSAPSGSGKTTLVRYLLSQGMDLAFSVSCTSRPPRGTEQDGVDYYFLTPEEFRQRIENDEFLEYEEVYTDKYYGTLKSEVERLSGAGHTVVFDVDVKGGVNIKKYYGDRALSLFIQAPSIEELSRRLHNRGTDSEEVIQQRLEKAAYELTFAPLFDHIIVNDVLEVAQAETLAVVNAFLNAEEPTVDSPAEPAVDSPAEPAS